MKYFFQMFSKLFPNATVNDEIHGGVESQEKIVKIGQQIKDNWNVIFSFLIAKIKVLEDRLFRERKFEGSKRESISVAGDENEDHGDWSKIIGQF